MGNQIADDCWLLFNTIERGMQIINVSIMMFIVIHCAFVVLAIGSGYIKRYRAQSISDAVSTMCSDLKPARFSIYIVIALITLKFIQCSAMQR